LRLIGGFWPPSRTERCDHTVHWDGMGLFAALMTYLVAAALLIGGAVAGLSVLLAPSDMLTARSSAPPLVRAADRKAPQSAKSEAVPQVRIVAPAPANQPSLPLGPAAKQSPANPSQASNAAPPKEQVAAQPVRKKKIAKKSAPSLREADTTTLGYGPSEPQRRFIFPLDPGW
jgi:hypothetical protein